MQDQFPVALDVFVRGLRAGHPIAAALDLLTVEMPDPIGSQFGIVVDEVTYGADLRDALAAMADRWDLEDMRMFVVSLSVQSETGGNLAEILENLSKVIRERASMMLKVRALVERRPDDRDHADRACRSWPSRCCSSAIRDSISTSRTIPPSSPALSAADPLYVIGFVTIRRMVDLKV